MSQSVSSFVVEMLVVLVVVVTVCPFVLFVSVVLDSLELSELPSSVVREFVVVVVSGLLVVSESLVGLVGELESFFVCVSVLVSPSV